MVTRLTPQGFAKLQNELDELVKVRRKEVAEKLREATEGQDFEDNPELEAVRMEQAFIEGRILELQSILATAEVLDEPLSKDKVDLGTTVTIKDDDGLVEKFLVVSPAEANPMENKISNQSPIGKAIFGKAVGDTTKVHTPDGDYTVEIVAIE